MKWVEMIRVRSSAESLEKGLPAISAQAKQIGKLSGIVEVLVLKHALFDGDLAVVLLWDNDRQPVRTREGLMLAEGMQRYGIVDHGVWTAAPGFKQRLDLVSRESSAE